MHCKLCGYICVGNNIYRNWRCIAFAHYITTMHTLAHRLDDRLWTSSVAFVMLWCPTYIWGALSRIQQQVSVIKERIYWVEFTRVICRFNCRFQQRCRDRIVHKLHIILNCDATHDLTIGLNPYPEPKKNSAKCHGATSDALGMPRWKRSDGLYNPSHEY